MIDGVDLESLIDPAGLTAVERELLRLGVLEWQRSDGEWGPVPALLGYDDREDLRSDVERLAGLIRTGHPMSRRDCRRLLLATELAFASDTVGWARDWQADTGFTDRDTVTVLRGIQGKLAGIVHGTDVVVSSAGEAPGPAWQPVAMDDDDVLWTPFQRRFRFRPGMESWPAIDEPAPSVTLDLAPVFTAEHPEFAAAAAAIDRLTLLALVRVLEPGADVVVLDWQHQTYRLRPHLFACLPDPEWPITVFPNGDYHIFLTEDMTSGTFGHPWERTLCVFGEPLVSVLVPMLTGWLPVKRDNRL